MKTSIGTKGRAVTATLIIALAGTGCAQMGEFEDILGGALPGQGGDLRAEVQSVDTRDREIHVRTDDGRSADVLYDEGTRVVYRNQEYSVRALERGDLVRMRVEETRTGALYTDLVEVEQSVSERQDSGSAQRMEGSVTWIDDASGQFLLDPRNEGEVMVNLPSNPPSDMVRDFRNLDRNDYVRLEVRWISQRQVELVRFGWR